MKTINWATFETRLARGDRATVVDVRSASEFAAGHIPGAINIPLEEIVTRMPDLCRSGCILAVCETGKRATMAAESLAAKGIEADVLEGGTAAWRGNGKPLVSTSSASWSLERQVRLGAGVLVLIGTILSTFVSPGWLALTGFIGAGLTFAGITNTCGLAAMLRKMPWNRVDTGCAMRETAGAR